MIKRLFPFLVTGIGLVGFLIFGWKALHQSPPPPQRPVAMVAAPAPVMHNLLIAAHDLTPGSFLRPDDLATAAFGLQATPAGAWQDTLTTRATLVGALILQRVTHESVLFPADMLLPGDHGFLSAILSPGMRAYTLSRDQMLADVGLIWPGDRIDLILTQEMPTGTAPARLISAETVLTNLRVLAIGRELVQPHDTDDKSRNAQSDQGGVPSEAVTVEVTPADAERLAVAVRLGKVALAVRPPGADKGVPAGGIPVPAPVGSTTWAGNVMHSLGQIQPPPPPVSLHVFDGGADKEYKF